MTEVAAAIPTIDNAVAKYRRLESIDVLRGVIMILMALDHVRDFFGDVTINPTNLATTTVSLFLTRWITHFCAPVFFLLTGTGAFLSLRKRSKSELSRFLFTRGWWLLALEVLVVRSFGLQFNTDYRMTVLTVLWALGWSMIVLAGLVYLRTSVITMIGIVVIVAHNLLDPVQASSLGTWAPLWHVLHAPGVIVADPRHVVFVSYPLIPWIGVVAVGYGLGQVYHWTAERRRALLWRLGIGLTVAFGVLRAVNAYGDPLHWARQTSPIFTALSFLNTTKYPPSLLYLMMTLGPALCVLAAIDGRTPRFLQPALVFGKVPLFYYLVHLPLIHGLAVLVCFLRYGNAHWMFESPSLEHFPYTQPPGWPYDLPVVYLIWVGVVLALYPLSRWFAALKQRRPDWWWLSYL